MSDRLKKIYVAAVLILLYAPIAVMIAQSFNASRYRGHWTGFTLDWYGALLESEEILEALTNTLTIGLTAATIATILGLITCVALQGMRRRTRAALMSVANVPMLNADIVTGISLMLLFNQNLYEAALDLGASPWQTFRHVQLPLSLPGAVSAITLVFIPSLTTFFISALLGGNKILLIGNIIEQAFTAGYDFHIGSALSLVLMIFVVANMFLTMRFDTTEEAS